MNSKKNFLVIKHGALGDFILSFGPFAAIRKHHSRDHLALLTTSFFEDFAKESNYLYFFKDSCAGIICLVFALEEYLAL